MSSHPALAARLGSARALDVMEGTLAALEVLGRPTLAQDVSNADLAMHVRHLGTAGQSLAFQGRVSPSGQPAPFAWGALDESDRQWLREAYANLLAEKVAQRAAPVALRPPSGQPAMPSVNLQACLFCGVSSVSMAAAEVTRLGGQQAAEREVWRPISGINPSSIGGRMTPNRLSGYLCGRCADAVESAGAVGQTALGKALLAYLDATPGRQDDAARLRIAGQDATLVAWCVAAAPTVSTPWASLDLTP